MRTDAVDTQGGDTAGETVVGETAAETVEETGGEGSACAECAGDGGGENEADENEADESEADACEACDDEYYNSATVCDHVSQTASSRASFVVSGPSMG